MKPGKITSAPAGEEADNPLLRLYARHPLSRPGAPELCGTPCRKKRKQRKGRA